MNKEQILNHVRAQMTEKRFLHTLGVMKAARQLAAQYGADEDKAELAAMIHDVAKCWPIKDQAAYIVEHKLDSTLLNYEKELWHAEIGAHYAKAQYGVSDDEICQAIRYHTSGRVGMSLLEKVVWVADYIEPTRTFEGVIKARQLAELSLEKTMLYGLDSTITFLIEKNKIVYPMTMYARNDILMQLNQEE